MNASYVLASCGLSLYLHEIISGRGVTPLQKVDAEGSMLRALCSVAAAQSVTPKVAIGIMDKVELHSVMV